jgi:hypothetical protein
MPGDAGHASSSPDVFVELVRRAISHLPEVEERLSHGAPSYFVRGKKCFASVWPEGHHDDEDPHLLCAAAEGVQHELIAEDPDRFFRPPYVGHRGWIGLRLNRSVTDGEVKELCEDAYRLIAPASLVRQLDSR